MDAISGWLHSILSVSGPVLSWSWKWKLLASGHRAAWASYQGLAVPRAELPVVTLY